MPVVRPTDREEALDRVRAQLDEAAFSQAWEDGARLTLEEAIGLALEALSRGSMERETRIELATFSLEG